MSSNSVKKDPVDQIVDEITENLVNSFCPEDQKNILQMVKEGINEHYERRLASAKDTLESVENQYSTFRGGVEIN